MVGAGQRPRRLRHLVGHATVTLVLLVTSLASGVRSDTGRPVLRRPGRTFEFADVDLDGSGCVQGPEERQRFRMHIGRILGNAMDLGDIERALRATRITESADVNHDGKICQCDLLTIFLTESSISGKHHHAFRVFEDGSIFDDVDTDGDGYLTNDSEKEGLARRLAECVTMRKAWTVVDAMSKLEKDDGKLARSEYMTFINSPHHHYQETPTQYVPPHLPSLAHVGQGPLSGPHSLLSRLRLPQLLASASREKGTGTKQAQASTAPATTPPTTTPQRLPPQQTIPPVNQPADLPPRPSPVPAWPDHGSRPVTPHSVAGPSEGGLTSPAISVPSPSTGLPSSLAPGAGGVGGVRPVGLGNPDSSVNPVMQPALADQQSSVGQLGPEPQSDPINPPTLIEQADYAGGMQPSLLAQDSGVEQPGFENQSGQRTPQGEEKQADPAGVVQPGLSVEDTAVRQQGDVQQSGLLKQPDMVDLQGLTQQLDAGQQTDSVNPQSLVKQPGLVKPQTFVKQPGLVKPQAFVKQSGLVKPQSFVKQPGLVKPQAFLKQSGLVKPQSFVKQSGFVKPQSFVKQSGLVKPQSFVKQPVLMKPQSFVKQPVLMKPQSSVKQPGLAKPQSFGKQPGSPSEQDFMKQPGLFNSQPYLVIPHGPVKQVGPAREPAPAKQQYLVRYLSTKTSQEPATPSPIRQQKPVRHLLQNGSINRVVSTANQPQLLKPIWDNDNLPQPLSPDLTGLFGLRKQSDAMKPLGPVYQTPSINYPESFLTDTAGQQDPKAQVYQGSQRGSMKTVGGQSFSKAKLPEPNRPHHRQQAYRVVQPFSLAQSLLNDEQEVYRPNQPWRPGPPEKEDGADHPDPLRQFDHMSQDGPTKQRGPVSQSDPARTPGPAQPQTPQQTNWTGKDLQGPVRQAPVLQTDLKGHIDRPMNQQGFVRQDVRLALPVVAGAPVLPSELSGNQRVWPSRTFPLPEIQHLLPVEQVHQPRLLADVGSDAMVNHGAVSDSAVAGQG